MARGRHCIRLLIFMAVLHMQSCTASTFNSKDVCHQDNPAGCGCWSVTPGTTNYDCASKQLTSIPETYSDEAISLSFAKNQITTVRRGIFNHLINLVEIQFEDNKIEAIEAGAFDRLMKLKKLYLRGNRLTIIHQEMFRHLPTLERIDLTDNQITSIERYSFFSLPSLAVVDFLNNPVQCQCEERLLREFMTIATNPFLYNMICANLDNQPFLALKQNQFPECPTGENLFPPSGSRYCYACSSVSSLKECATKDQAQCIDRRATCYSRLEYTNTLQVYGGCSTFSNCQQWEQQNKVSCLKGKSYVSCYQCYPSNLGNKRDVTNLMKTFTMAAVVTFNKDMTAGLRDTSTTEYTGFTMNLGVQVYNYIYGLNGSYSVEFVKLKELTGNNAGSNVVAEFQIICNTIWFVSRQSVAALVEENIMSKYLQGAQVIGVDVTLVNEGQPYCPVVTVPDPVYGTIQWPKAWSGTSVRVTCPYQLGTSTEKRRAERACLVNEFGEGRWGTPNLENCPKADETSRQLQNLAETDVTEDNVETVSDEAKTLSSQWQQFESTEVGYSVDIVEDIIRTEGSTTSRVVIDNTLQIINNVLFVNEGVLSESQTDFKASSRLVSNIDKFVDRIAVDNGDYGQVTPNIAAFVSATSADGFTGLSMSFQAQDQQLLTDDKVNVQQIETLPPNAHSGLTVPKTLFSRLSGRSSSRVGKISSSIIREPKVFQSIAVPLEKEIVLSNNQTVKAVRTINSNIIGTSVPGVTLTNLVDPVHIVFQHKKDAVDPECVYWDTSGDAWRSDGCTINTTNDHYTVCHCSHLTNFALLMDVYGTGGGLSDADKLALAVISYIGCGLSFIAICLTLLTYLMFKKLRRDNPSKILMNLCLAIGLVDLVFVVGMQDYTSGSTGGCKVVAILLHYFLLAAIFWMAVEAFYMYLALVKVFDTYIARFQLKSSLFGWGLPLLIVVVTIAINKSDNYGVQPGGICWLDRIPFYAAFLAPVCLILVLNSISFVLVIRQISKRSSNKLTKTDKSSTVVRLRGAISLIVLLGLTWLFGILAVDNFGIAFHYLFAIFNSLQGFFIFIFYCVLKKEAQQSWRRKLPCLKSAYEQTTTSSGTNKGYSNTYDQKHNSTISTISTISTTSLVLTSSTCKANRANQQAVGRYSDVQTPSDTETGHLLHTAQSEYQIVWILMRRRVTRGLIWIQTVYKDGRTDSTDMSQSRTSETDTAPKEKGTDPDETAPAGAVSSGSSLFTAFRGNWQYVQGR